MRANAVQHKKKQVKKTIFLNARPPICDADQLGLTASQIPDMVIITYFRKGKYREP